MLKITNLSISINDKAILKNFNFTAQPGSTHILMGPNGSGKSTLAYALMGHPRYQIDAPSISFNGIDIQALAPHERAKKGIFLAFQHPYEIAGVSVMTFLKESYVAIHGQISLSDFKNKINQALSFLSMDESFLSRAVNVGFSGGEKKRLELLQLLMLEPSLIILDEIDSGLDVDGLMLIQKVLDYLRAFKPDMICLYITHYLQSAHAISADQVHIISQGTLVKSGSLEILPEIQARGYDAFLI